MSEIGCDRFPFEPIGGTIIAGVGPWRRTNAAKTSATKSSISDERLELRFRDCNVHRDFPRVRRASSKACRTLESSVFRSTREYNPFNVAISPFLFELNSVIAMPCSLFVVSICSFQFQSDKKKRWRRWEEEEEGEGEEEEEEEEEGEVGGRPTYLSSAFR